MLQHILAIGCTILQTAQELDQLVVHAMLIRLEYGVLAGLANLVVHFLAGLFHHLLNAGGMDAAVHNELLHGNAGNLAADGVEGGYNDGLGGVVDHQIHAGGGFQGADVAALAADDAALHVIVGQGHHGHGGFSHMVGSALLNGQRNDVAGLLLALLLGLGLDIANHGGRVVEGFLLHALDDDLLGLVLGHGGNALQLGGLLGQHGLGVLLHLLDFSLLFVQAFLAGLHVVGLLVQGFLALDQAALAALHLVAALAHFALVLSLFPVVFRLGPEDFLLGLQHLFLLVLIGLAHRVVVEMLGILLRAADFLFRDVFAVGSSGHKAAAGRRQGNQNP